jgi:hypothetical protein
MTTTKSDFETVYNQGVYEARFTLGAGVQPHDELRFGLRAVLRAGGRESSIMDLWTRYQDPIGLLPEGCGIDRIVGAIVANTEQRVLPYYQDKLAWESKDRYYSYIRCAWDMVKIWDFRRQVMELIERDIKTQIPGIRRNTRQFKRLAQMVFAQAQMAILQAMSRKLGIEIGTLRLQLNQGKEHTVGHVSMRLESAGRHLQELAADIAVLQPGAPVIEPLTRLAEQFKTRAGEILMPVDHAIEDMERVRAMIDQIHPDLVKADAARRAWASATKKLESKSFKGELRRQLEHEALVARNDAERLELAVAEMLRTENFLCAEEKMLCDL